MSDKQAYITRASEAIEKLKKAVSETIDLYTALQDDWFGYPFAACRSVRCSEKLGELLERAEEIFDDFPQEVKRPYLLPCEDAIMNFTDEKKRVLIEALAEAWAREDEDLKQ
jgi:hypothetical protein